MTTNKRYQDMTAEELAQATREFDAPGVPGGKPMSKKDRQWFDAWQKRALAHEAADKSNKTHDRLTLVLPKKLTARIDELAKQKHTTPATLVRRIVRNAIYKAVA